MFLAMYDGPVFLNKASQEQKDAANQNKQFTTDLMNHFNTEFGQSQNIQGALNAKLQSIMNQGMAGKGYLNGEEAALRSDATEQNAQANQQAEQATAARQAARSEGGALTSGAVAAQDANRSNQLAAEEAAAQRGITERNAQLARQNVSEGAAGLGNLAGTEASQADSLAGTASSNAANSYQEVTQAFQPSGFWGALGGGLLSMIPYVGPAVGKAFDRAVNGPNQATPLPFSAINGTATPIEDAQASQQMDLSSLLDTGLPTF